MKKFKLQLERQGANFVSVLKHEKGNEYSLHWRIELENDQPIVLMDFYAENRFIVVDWMAQVWAFDLDKKEKIYEKAFSTKITGKAVFSEDKAKLFICYSKPKAHVATLDLSDFSIIQDLEYPDTGYVYFFERYLDKLLLYSCTDGKAWSHGYSIIDIETGEFSKQLLPFTQFSDFDLKRPTLDQKNEKLIMPYWGDVEFRKVANDEPIFMYKMMIVDMKTFELEKIIPVREFPVKQIDCYERDSIKSAERLLADEKEEDYRDALGNLIGNLNSTVLDADGKSFWLCWRGGIVRRVDYDGNMSPLYAAKTKENSTVKNAFEHNFYHCHLNQLRDDGVILQEAERNWMPIKDMNQMGADIGDFIAIDLLEVPADAQIVISKSEDDLEVEAERIYNVVPLGSIKDPKAVLAALDFMIDSEWKRVGHYLAFLFKLNDKSTISEKEFFKQIWEIDGALDRMEKIAAKALEFGVHDRWGGDNDETALLNLFIPLCGADAKYHKLGFQFLNDMDRDHDDWSCQLLIGAIVTRIGPEAFGKELENWEELAEFIENSEYN